MKKYIITFFILLIASSAWGDTVDVDTPFLLSTVPADDPTLGIPRHKIAVDRQDSLEYWVICVEEIFYTDDNFSTQDSMRVGIGSGDIHTNLAIITEDSVGIQKSEVDYYVVSGNTVRGVESSPTGFSRGMMYGDSANERYWTMYRSADPFTYNYSYFILYGY